MPTCARCRLVVMMSMSICAESVVLNRPAANTSQTPIDSGFRQLAFDQLLYVRCGLSVVSSNDFVPLRQAATPLIASPVINFD